MKEIYYEDIIEWFDALNELIWECNIKRENIYNMNKIESSIEIFQRKYIIINNWNEINVRENWIWEIEMSYYDEICLCQ